MWAEIERMTSRESMTILLTTHYLEEADRLAANLAIVDHGRVAVAGTPDALKDELRGDGIVVELAAPTVASGPPDGGAALAARVTAAVGTCAGVRDVHVEGRTLRARADSGAVALPAVLAALDAAGLPVASATLARPSLDDVYLRHTGRTFTAAQSSADATPGSGPGADAAATVEGVAA
jgi:ABC-2 type transport system ATP-binding protein